MKLFVSSIASALLLAMSGLAQAGDGARGGRSLGAGMPDGLLGGAEQLLGELGVTTDSLLNDLRVASLSHDILNSQKRGSMSRVLGDGLMRRPQQTPTSGMGALGADAKHQVIGGICKTKMRGFDVRGAGLQRGSMAIAVACMESGGYRIFADRSVVELARSGETAVLFADGGYRQQFKGLSGVTSLDSAGRPTTTVGIHRIYAQLVQRNPSLAGQTPPRDVIRVSVDY